MRAVLYARVSSKDQAEEGYSLQDQLRTLRGWAESNGYEVVEEVTDPGYSGASLERPGLGRVRDLVAAGGVDLVLAQDRDRIARDPIITGWLQIQFEQHGTRLRALNDPDEDSPTSRLTTGILDQIAQFERAMTTQRTRRGRFQRAREGKVIGSGSPPYGFRYNEDRTTFVPDPETMPIVRRMFEFLASGSTIGSVAKRFEREGLPTPNGGKHWYVPSLKRMVENDVYRGVWWYGQNRVKLTPMGEKKRTWEKIDRSEWIAIPVADSGIPHEVIDAARENVARAYRPRKASVYDYELRGMVRCACCGTLMNGYSAGQTKHRYYRCQQLRKFGKASYPDGAARNADKLEREVMRHVDSLLENPDKVRQQLDAAIEAETTRNPDEDAIGWLRIVEECDRKRAAYQDQQAAGYMTLQELGPKLAELNTSKATAQAELDRVQEGRRRVDELEATKTALLTTYKDVLTYDGVRYLPWEVRRELYEAMRLQVTVPKVGPIRVRCDVTQQVIRLSRAVEEWATEEAEHEGQLYSSQRTDKVMAEVAS